LEIGWLINRLFKYIVLPIVEPQKNRSVYRRGCGESHVVVQGKLRLKVMMPNPHHNKFIGGVVAE